MLFPSCLPAYMRLFSFDIIWSVIARAKLDWIPTKWSVTLGVPIFPMGVPIFPGKWGPRVPILLGRWGPGSPFYQEDGDPGPHSPGKMGTRGPHFRGSPFSHDTGSTKFALPRQATNTAARDELCYSRAAAASDEHCS